MTITIFRLVLIDKTPPHINVTHNRHFPLVYLLGINKTYDYTVTDREPSINDLTLNLAHSTKLVQTRLAFLFWKKGKLISYLFKI